MVAPAASGSCSEGFLSKTSQKKKNSKGGLTQLFYKGNTLHTLVRDFFLWSLSMSHDNS